MLSGRVFKIYLLAGIFLFSGFFLLSAPQASAEVLYDLRGKAYWGQYGYIYFHCIDSVIGNRFDETENLKGGSTYLPPATQEFHFYSEPCVNEEYGVKINKNGRFYGRAWNPSFGWINFFGDGEGLIDFGFNSGCSAVSCTKGSGCIACFNFEEQKAYGWARIESTNQYISLNDKDNDNLDTGVVVRAYTKVSSPIFPGVSGINLGDFAGTAQVRFGPQPTINFNCLTEGHPNPGTCASRQYKVYIGSLILGRLSAPNWTYSQACAGDALTAVLRWEKLSGTQSAFEVVVNNKNSFDLNSADYVCWSGKINTAASQYIISNINCGGRLQYNTNYHWWLRGYDSEGRAMEWIQYDANSLSSTDGNPDNNPLTFTTFRHRFPNPFFTWQPLEITTGTTTLFTSLSSAANTDNPDVLISCDSARCPGYLWQTNDSLDIISSPNNSSTDIIFQRAANNAVTLRVTDSTGYFCSLSLPLSINYGLPLWREVKAQ